MISKQDILQEIKYHEATMEEAVAGNQYRTASEEAFQLSKLFYLLSVHDNTNASWIPVSERLPEKRSNYEVTFINSCGFSEHGFAQWYDGEFHIPAVVIAWREHLDAYQPK